MSITLHQLKVFVEVAKCLSVSKAAQQLHMTQPAVSNILKQLQDHFNCQLTDVVARRLYLTPFGEALLEASQDIHKRIDQAHDEINLIKGAVSGTLKVACVSTAKYFTPSLLGKFKLRHPKVKINLTVVNRQGLISRIQENLDDFAIMSHPPKQIPVDAKRFYTDELIVAASSQFKPPVNRPTLEQLSDQEWIAREMGSGTRYATEKILKKYDFQPNYCMQVSDGEGIKQAIIANMGLSIISKQSVNLELENNLIQEVSVKGFPVNHYWYFVTLKGKTLSPLSSNFFKFAKQIKLTSHD